MDSAARTASPCARMGQSCHGLVGQRSRLTMIDGPLSDHKADRTARTYWISDLKMEIKKPKSSLKSTVNERAGVEVSVVADQ